MAKHTNEVHAEKSDFVKRSEKIDVVNYHFTGKCNFRCAFCFAKDMQIIAPQNVFQQFKIMNEIKAFFSCVSKFNHSQNLSALFERVSVDRFKIIRAYEVRDVNADSNAFVTDAQFEDFCKRHSIYKPVVEDNKDLEGSYIIIYPDGKLVSDRGNQYKAIGNILHKSLTEIAGTGQFIFAGYNKRYNLADYENGEELA